MNKPAVPRIEWLTLLLLLIHYLAFVLVCMFYHHLPWWVVLFVGAYLVALHGSLQHEVIHGHPTRNRMLNEILVFPAIGLWLPFDLYRDSHLKHHIDDRLTDPFEDPESYFVASAQWQSLGQWQRTCYWIRNTVPGRLVFGPVWACLCIYRVEITRLINGDTGHLKLWLKHLLAVALVIGWLRIVNISLVEYIVLFAYPGLALSMLRSFLEHQVDENPARRTVVVKSGKVMGLLFLNNNLHALHHEQPALPWYQLPHVWQQTSSEILERNGGYFYHSYFQVIKKYFFSPKAHPRHPFI